MPSRPRLGSFLAGAGILLLAVAVIDRGNLLIGGVGAVSAFIGLGMVSRFTQRLRRGTRRLGVAIQSGALGYEAVDVPELEVLRAGLIEAEGRANDVIEERDKAVRRLQQVLGALVEGAIIVDGDDIVYSNPAASEMLGRDVPRSLRALTPHAFHRMVEKGRLGQTSDAIVELDRNRTVAVSAVAVEADVVLLAMRDLTDRFRVDAIRRDFVADASHELKTPIASIQSAAETVQVALPDDPEGAQRFVEQILQHSERLGRIVNDLLDLSRLEAREVERTSFDLGVVVSDETLRHTRAAESRAIDLEAEFDSIAFEGSLPDVRLAVRNLVENALRYSEPGGVVKVRASRENGTAVVTVSDDGIGIPARDLPRVFERFYRVDTARARDTGGTGLGLAIVRHVVDRHGGTVNVESELGSGSTFTVRLPLTA